MTTAEMIKELCEQMNISVSELARRSDSSFELSHFEDFMDKRQKLMSDALKAILL